MIILSYFLFNFFSDKNCEKEEILSFFMKLSSCLSSCLAGRGQGLGVGRHEGGTSKMLGGSTGLVDPPGIFIIGVSDGQCFSQIWNLAGSGEQFLHGGSIANHICCSPSSFGSLNTLHLFASS